MYGIGTMVYEDGSRYEGLFKDGLRCGHGIFTNNVNEVYEG